MKKIIYIFIFFISAAIISCSDSSNDSTEAGYVNPGLGSVKQLISEKSYTFSDTNIPDHFGAACGAIIYQDASYAGFAAGLDSTNPSFSLKVYWPGAITVNGNTTDTTTYSGATVKINSSTYTGPITLNITTNTATANDSGIVTYYTIVFKNNPSSPLPLSVGTYTINDGDQIIAYKY